MAELIEEGEIVRLVQGLSPAELELCLWAGWVIPAETGGARRYLEIDVARIRLIHELKIDIGLDDEAVPVVLSLIDQLHALRRELACIAQSLSAEPEEVRRRILSDAAARRGVPSAGN